MMSKAHFNLKKQLLTVGLSLALVVPFSMSSATAVANTDRSPGLKITATSSTKTAALGDLRIQADAAIFSISDSAELQVVPDTSELQAGDYRLVLGLATFSEVSDSKVDIKFDGEKLSWKFWAEDQDNQKAATEGWINLKPTGELGLEMSDLISIYRSRDDTTIEVHSEQFCETESGSPLTLTPDFLQDYLDMACLCFDFWIGED